MAIRGVRFASSGGVETPDVRLPYNKQLQRTVIRRHGDGASAPFHYALAPRFTRQHAAAELRRYVTNRAEARDFGH